MEEVKQQLYDGPSVKIQYEDARRSYRLGVRELELVGLVTVQDVTLGRLQVASDAAARRAVVEDRLEVPAAVDAALELGAREAADVDLARPDGDHAGAVRADVVVLVALAAELLERVDTVVLVGAAVGGLAHRLGLVGRRAG